SSSAADARAAELQALAEAELGRAVDVSRPPLVRAHVVRTGRSTAVLMLAAHHLVIDGWSTPLLVARILAAAAGEAVADGWPDLRRALADQVARDPAPAREAWAAHLAGIDEPTLLAAPAAGPVTPRTLDVPLDPAAGERLLAAIRERGLTVGTVVTGAWAHVAARARGAADVVVGTTTAGRGSAVEGLDRVIGLLSATVPVRVRLHPAEPFSLQLARLQQERAELQEHEGLPLADIESLAGVGTLFDSLVVVENYPDAVAASPGGLRVSDVQAAGATHYALGITVLPGAGLRIAIEHDLSRVSETRADALAAEFAAVLARLADDLDVTPLALPAPSDGTVLVGAQPASTPDDGSGACAVLRSFRAAVRAAPDAVALRTRDGAITAVELDAMAGGIQAALEGRGVTADTIIAIALPRSAHVVAAIIGTLASGAAYLPLDLSAPDERTLLVLDDARPAVVVAARASAVGRLAEARGIPVVDPAEVAPTGLVPRAVPGDAAAYVIFTSGSTGHPKGVVLTRHALDTHFDGLRTGHQAELVARLQRTEGRARVVAVHSASFSFDTSLVQLHWLFAGHELLLLDDDERRDPDLFVARARHADVIDVAPVLAEQLVAAGLVDGERPLPEVFLGGEAVSDALWTALRERAATTRTHNLYGPTESTVDALGAVVTDSIDPLIGTPVAGVTATVLDGWLRPVPRTTAGELYLEGGQLARGYLGRAGLTATRFVAAPGGLRRYRTGDLVRVDDLDRVVYLGRLDDQVKVAGHRIELGEVEQAVREVDGVAAAAATIDQAGSVGARLIAAVVPAAGWELDGAGVRAHLAERLPVALVPSQVVVVDALPVGVSGKVDRAAVRAIAAQTVESDDREVQPPRTPEEEALVRAVSVVLDRPTVSVDDDFFALGGHSLTALRILGALRAVGYGLSIRDILDGRRLDRIAVRLRTLAASPAAQTRVGQRFGAVPVSTAQRRLLFLAELEGASAAYTVPVALDLHGRIPVEGLASAWAEVVERHPVLRTVYRRTDGGFAAEALADPPDAFAVVTLDPAASTADFEAAVAIEEGRTFDVFAAPPVRATLVLAGERAAFVVAAHHIAVDEASFTVIFEELSSLIAGRSLPDAVPFSVLVAAAEEARDPLHDSALAERWLARLRGIPAELELPSDRPRPERSSFHAVTARAEVPSHLADSLAAFAAAQGVTSLMVLQTAVASLLHALGAGDDIVLGTPLSRRDDRGAERTVGYLVDTLPIRLDVSGDADLPGLVARTKAAVLDALDDAELPFEAIVEAVSPPRSLSRHPLFQTMVSIEGAVAPALVLPGVTVSERAGLVDAARLDLAIRYRAAEGEAASLILVAAADLFEAESAERLLARLVAWIERLLDEPHRPVRVIDARLHDERERLLALSSAVAAPRLLDGIADRVHADPDAQAVVGADRTLDYAGLAASVVGLAAELRAQGVGVEDRVAVAVGRSSSLVVSLLAVLAVGAAYVPVDADYPEARVRLMLDDAAPALVLVDGSTRGAGRGRPELSVDDAPVADRDPLALADALHAAAHIPGTAAAYVIYTSGSTGRPKGVVVSRAALDAFLAHETGVLALTPEDRLLAVTTISFDIAALELYVPLLSGAAVVLADRGDVRDPDRLVALAVRTGCTMLQATPSLWRPLLDAHPDAWSGVTALVGGEALPGALAGALREACRSVRNVYGPTEATVWATACVVDDVTVADTGAGSAVAIGAPFAGVGALVLDDSLRPVPDGVAGELYLSGLQLARGYHARPDLTVARFVADPHGAPGCRMYRTGDLVRRDAGGALRFLRRADDQVKVNGHRIELGEVEAALRSVDGVAHAAAVVRPDSEGRGRLQGYVVPAGGATLDPLQVRDELAASVPGPLVPQTVTVLEAIPLTLNGKVDRAALPEPAVVAPTGREPRTDAERAIVEAVAATLGLHRVSPDDAFFELGGDSISSIRLVALVRARGFVITPGLVFAHERLAGLAGAAVVLADASVDDAATEGAHPARRTRARIGARDLSSIERLLENSP
ncbi:MAG: amino acid adenylation domain-containing protein, partial [Microbacterium sp.]